MMSPPRLGKVIGRCLGPTRRRRLRQVGNLFPPGRPATAFANDPRGPHNTTRDRHPTPETLPVADNDLTPPAAAAAPAPAPFDIEKPACFYLGREYDLGRHAVLPDNYVMYD